MSRTRKPTDVVFGSRLRRARKSAGLSQRDLEIATGVPKARISRYENGHVLPSLPIVVRLARSCQVELGDLVSGLWVRT